MRSKLRSIWCLANAVKIVNRYLTIIPQARMDSESIALRLKAEWAIDSRAMRARGINCFSKIQLVGQTYRDKTTLAS